MNRSNAPKSTILSQQSPSLKRLYSSLGCQRGTFAVEFALIAPLLLLMLVGAYDVSTIIQENMVLQNATRVGIQYGLIRRPVQGDLQPVENAVKTSLPSDWLGDNSPYSAKVAVTIQCECSQSGATSCSSGCPVGEQRMSFLGIEVKKTSKFLFQYPGLGESIDLHDKSLVRLQ